MINEMLKKYGCLHNYTSNNLEFEALMYIGEIKRDISKNLNTIEVIVGFEVLDDFSIMVDNIQYYLSKVKSCNINCNVVISCLELSNKIPSYHLKTTIYILKRDDTLTYRGNCNLNLNFDEVDKITISEYDLETVGRIKQLNDTNLNDIITHKLIIKFLENIEVGDTVLMNEKYFEIIESENVNESDSQLVLHLTELAKNDNNYI